MSKMDATQQQVVFFSLIRVIFKDKSHTGIDEKNCAGFYRFLINRLEEDTDMYATIDNEEKFYFFETVIRVLKEFETYDFSTIKKITMSHRSFVHFLTHETPIKISAFSLGYVTKSLRFKYSIYKRDFLKEES